jgi:hypothetical protein
MLPYAWVFKSFDGGKNREPFKNGLSIIGVGSLVISSNGLNILYAGSSRGIFRMMRVST